MSAETKTSHGSWAHGVRRRLSEDRHLLFSQPHFTLAPLDYDGYWEARGGASDSRTLSIWQNQRVEWLAPHLAAGDVVLDLGCGGSGTLNALRERVDISGIGADVSQAALERLREDGYEALAIDLNDRPALGRIPQVDYVLAFELLEHLPEPEAVLATLLPRVRKGFWVSFPNTGYWAYRMRLLMGRTPMQWIRHPGEHLRFWTLRDLRWWAGVLDRDLGLSLRHLRVYRGPRPLNRVWPGLFGMAFMFLLEKRGGR
jgi:methionine biosynthesis protein MetW